MSQAEEEVRRVREQLDASEKLLRTQAEAHKIEVSKYIAKTQEAETKAAHAEEKIKHLEALLAAGAKEAEVGAKEVEVRAPEYEAEPTEAESLARKDDEKWFAEEIKQKYEAKLAKGRHERSSMISQVLRMCNLYRATLMQSHLDLPTVDGRSRSTQGSRQRHPGIAGENSRI